MIFMKKQKASFVSVLVTAMLAVIDFGLFLLNKQAFAYLTGTLALYGLIRGCIDFYFWLLHNPQGHAPTEAKKGTRFRDQKKERSEDQPQSLAVPPVFEDFCFGDFLGEESTDHVK